MTLKGRQESTKVIRRQNNTPIGKPLGAAKMPPRSAASSRYVSFEAKWTPCHREFVWMKSGQTCWK